MFESPIDFVLGGLGFLFVISLVVFVHELGHFMAGRFFGIRIDSFSIGFGREIMGFTDRHGTRWKFSWLPLGGYVKFWGDEGVSSATPDREKLQNASSTDLSQSFHHKVWWQKAIVSAAGPIANFVLAIVILTGLFLSFGEYAASPVIGAVKPGLPAENAGLKAGDVVTKINGEAIQSFRDIVNVVSVSAGHTLQFQIKRGNEFQIVPVTPVMISKPDGFGDPIKDPGIGISPVIPGEIESVAPNTPASIAGLKPRDIIVAVNKQPITNFSVFAKAVEQSNGRAIALIVARPTPLPKKPWNRASVEMSLIPTAASTRVSEVDAFVLQATGISVLAKGAPEPYTNVTFGLFDAVSRAGDETKFIVVKTFYFIGQLLTGSADYQQLSGPIGIATVSAKVTVEFGVVSLINLAAVLSVSIGLLNLFPIPMLDGGHILYYGIEAVRGRPLGERAQELGFRIGLAFVLCLLLFATWNDLTKLGIFG